MTVRVPVVVAQVDAVGEVRVAAEVAPRRGTVGRQHCGAARRVSVFHSMMRTSLLWMYQLILQPSCKVQ